MSETMKPNQIWGFNAEWSKEQRLKRFVEHQDNEATRIREATELLAREAAVQTAALGQIASILHALHHESNLGRITPDILFQAIQIKQQVLDIIKNFCTSLEVTQTSNSTIPMEISQSVPLTVKTMKELVNVVCTIDRTYLIDFSQKKALEDLRCEMAQLLEQWNKTSLSSKPLRNLIAQQIVSERYPVARKLSYSEFMLYATKRNQWLRARTAEATSNNQNKASSNSDIAIIAYGGGGSLLIFSLYLMHMKVIGLGVFMLLLIIPLLLLVIYKIVTAGELSPTIPQSASLFRELCTIHSPEDYKGLKVIEDELAWINDAWVLNKRGNAAIALEIDKFLSVKSIS